MPRQIFEKVELRHGQAHIHLYPPIARSGAKKKLTDPAIAHGMVRQTRGSFGFHHGVTVEDEPMTTKVGHTGTQSPIHAGMSRQTTGNGSDVLKAAGDYDDNRKFGPRITGKI
jgi:hypothetical protein